MAMTAAVPVLPVSRIDRSSSFYADVLGFRVVHADEGYAVLACDGVQVHLWAASDETWRDRSGGSPVVSGAESFLAGTASCRIRVDDPAAEYERLKPSGAIHPNGHLAAKDYGLTEFGVLDPDGNLVVFYAPTGSAG